MRLYVYKCICDDGGAPCIDGGRLSLTICKPRIRSRAQAGDLIFAFGSNYQTPANRLIYVARVTQRIDGGEYYARREFRSRGDCIYRRGRGGVYVRRHAARFHTEADHRPRDLGPAPEYPRAIALVSDDFRYFGAAGTDDWKAMAPKLRRVVESLGQGHRVNHSAPITSELLNLAKFVKHAFRRRVNGRPRDGEANSCSSCRPRGYNKPRQSRRSC